MKKYARFGLILCSLFAHFAAFSGSGWADDSPVPGCALPKDTKAPRGVFKMKSYLYLILPWETQGEQDFKPHYTQPHPPCRVESFSAGGNAVTSSYVPWAKDEQTLLFQFTAKSEQETREFVVLYNGLASLMDNDTRFYVVEHRGTQNAIYGVYRDEPGYGAMKILVTKVLAGEAVPMMLVDWAPGAKEPAIMMIDKKLK